ncbi:MAG: T9SS type A sorting domain-containing protein [Candidatus Sabulitectum sp.]|nr:T9SS type A sorting domain-containing protein [Candidatus Sabulitectum sp.]
MSGTTTYMSTTLISYEGCYALTYSSSAGGYTNKTTYISDYSATPVGYDIGYQQNDGVGDIWMANDNATSPVSCYEAGSGGIVSSLQASIGIGSDIRGVTFEGASGQFMWVSNQTTDEIYRIALYTDIEEGSTLDLPGSANITLTQNPIYSSTLVNFNGFPGEVSVEVFDLRGRRVISEFVEGSLLLNGEQLPSGTYIIRATDEEGNTAACSAVKL